MSDDTKTILRGWWLFDTNYNIVYSCFFLWLNKGFVSPLVMLVWCSFRTLLSSCGCRSVMLIFDSCGTDLFFF